MWGMIAVESGPYYAFINYIHIDNRVKHIYCLSLYNCQINTETERMKANIKCSPNDINLC
jgi:hypothetical protein